MPSRRRKPFIDKKNAVTFHLVHRSQRDPLQADEDAPKRVLLPASDPQAIQTKKDEQRKFGVFYDDEYDYMQHLRDVKELYTVEPIQGFNIQDTTAPNKGTKLKLPSAVFASDQETDVGLLNKAAPLRGPQLDWDPDIVAGLDEDFNFDDPENILEDDFVVQAMEGEVDFHENEDDAMKERRKPKKSVTIKEGSDNDEDIPSDEADNSDVGSDFGSDFDIQSFSEEETKSRFTAYSMTSSVIRRNQGLTLLDDRFEKIYEQYDDEEIGALDEDDIAGFAPQNGDLLNTALEEFEDQLKRVRLKDAIQPYEGEVSDSESDSEVIAVADDKPKEKWDCESILSTYSNLYNHPKLIVEPKKVKPIHMKTIDGSEIPADILTKRGLTKKQLQQLDKQTEEDNGSIEYIQTYRPKDESKEEKKARKNLVKEGRRARREEKKATKIAFKSEKQKQEKDLINVRQSQQSVRIL